MSGILQFGKLFCHYFNNQKKCPFEEIGCMFLHADSEDCKFQNTCNKNLCQFKHQECDKSESESMQIKPKESDGITWCEVCEYDYESEDLNEHEPNAYGDAVKICGNK